VLGCGALAALLALIAGVEVADVAVPAIAGAVLLGVVVYADYITSRRAWRESVVRLSRNTPPAFALLGMIWRDVLFVLSTHSEGGVTSKDVDLAIQIDRLAREAGVAPAGTG